MKYTKNAHLKIKNLGFVFKYQSADPDEEINYEVWQKGLLEATICHTSKLVYFSLGAEINEINLTEEEVMQLDKILNKDAAKNKIQN